MIKSLKDLLDKLSRFTNSLVYDGGICKRLTSFTISPDDIAILASGDRSAPLELTFFAHDGKKVYVKGAKEEGAKLYRTLVGIEEKYR